MIATYAPRVLFFGGALILLGLAMIAYDPHLGKVAYYPKAMTGFAIPAGIGAVAIVCGLLIRAGKKAALWTALALMFLSMAAFTKRSLDFRKAAAAGETHKSYAMMVTGVMAAVSFISLISTARGMAFLPKETK